MSLIIRNLIWDDWNLDHIKKHSVLVTGVEQSLRDKYVVFIAGHSRRVLSLGRADERLITTVLERQGDSQDYYVVTARDMAKKERLIYRQQMKLKEVL